MRLKVFHDCFQNPADCILNGFIGQHLFRGVDQRQVEVRRAAVLQRLFLQPVCLLGTASQQVAFVGPLVEFLGHGEQYLDRSYLVGLGEPDVPEREDKPALPALEHAAHGTERTEPFRAGKRAVGHGYFICGVRQCGACGSFWPVCAAGCG